MASEFHSAGTSVQATTAGAVVGSIETPYAAVGLGGSTTDLLSTGDLTVAEAGEMGGLPEMTVEFWFQTASLPGSNQSFMAGPLSSFGANRQWQFTLNTTGTIFGSIVDEGGTVRGGTSSSVLTVGAWNHIVMAAQGGAITIYINNVANLVDAAWSTHTVRALGATGGSLDLRIIGPATTIAQYYDKLAVYRFGLSATRIAEHYRAGTAMGFPVQGIGERMTAVLDNIGSAAPRSLQAGVRPMIERYMSGQSPLEEMRHAVEADDVDAALFVTASGALRFLDASHRSSSPYTTSQATFGDVGGAELPYLDCKTDYSPAFLINEWNVTRTARGPTTPATQTSSDATSISRYFKRSQSLSDVPVRQDSEASTIAAALLAKYKDPQYRVTEIAPKMSDANTALAVLNRELMDKITVKRRPPGGGAVISQDLFIQQITISGTPGVPPSCSFGVSPL